MRLCILETGEVVVPELEIAATVWQQSIGLIGRRKFPAGSGLWISPCNGIHTFGVRFPIDVLFLDREGHLLRIVRAVPPCRVVGPVRHARTVVELPAQFASASRLVPGTRLTITV